MKELNNAMTDRIDLIYDEADALLTLLHPAYEHDMALCGEVVDAAESILAESNMGRCYPYCTDEVRCDEDIDKNGCLCCGFKTCLLVSNTDASEK